MTGHRQPSETSIDRRAEGGGVQEVERSVPEKKFKKEGETQEKKDQRF
jgi:hypothetical protein